MLGTAAKALFAVLALVIGGAILAWVGYNELVERLPQYQRPPVAGIFGIAPAMIVVGLHWGRQALAAMRGADR
jgi:hypothetical protein